MRVVSVADAFRKFQSVSAKTMSALTEPQEKLVQRITVLFGVSFVLLTLHILDDAFVTGEPGWYRISVGEFLIYLALIFGIVGSVGLWLTRRGSAWGFIILILYASQALYGAGLNHIRHLFGDFRGSQLLPTIVSLLGIQLGDLGGHGFLSLLAGLTGLIGTPPHTHTLQSAVVVFLGVGVNISLIILLVVGLTNRPGWRHERVKIPRRAG